VRRQYATRRHGVDGAIEQRAKKLFRFHLPDCRSIPGAKRDMASSAGACSYVRPG
jgi:hypothetical protein